MHEHAAVHNFFLDRGFRLAPRCFQLKDNTLNALPQLQGCVDTFAMEAFSPAFILRCSITGGYYEDIENFDRWRIALICGSGCCP
jgi:hypothetical protein